MKLRLQTKRPRRLRPSCSRGPHPDEMMMPIAMGCSIAAETSVAQADTTDVNAAMIIRITAAGRADGRPRPSSLAASDPFAAAAFSSAARTRILRTTCRPMPSGMPGAPAPNNVGWSPCSSRAIPA